MPEVPPGFQETELVVFNDVPYICATFLSSEEDHGLLLDRSDVVETVSLKRCRLSMNSS